MAKKSYSRRSYRRRRTNKKNYKKSYKKSYKKGGMFAAFHGLAEEASRTSTASPLAGEETHLEGDSIDIDGMKGLFEMVASRDVRNATIHARPVNPVNPLDAQIFDANLKPGQIVEIKHNKGDSIRWFGVIERRALKSRGGVYVRWFKEINNEGQSFSLELDKHQPRCNFIDFHNIIGIVEF